MNTIKNFFVNLGATLQLEGLVGLHNTLYYLGIILLLTLLIILIIRPGLILKSLKKHLTLINIVTGLITLLFIVSIKELGLALILLNVFKEYIQNMPECSEYIIASFTGLIIRLGLKGLIEEGFKDLFPTYNTMAAGGDINSDINPAENNNSAGIKGNTSGSSSSPSNSTDVQESLSNKDKNSEKANDSTTSNSQNSASSRSNYSSKRYVQLFDAHAARLSAEIKALSTEIQNCQDSELKTLKEEDLEELFGQLTMLSKESAVETRKILSTDSQISNKRTSDSTVTENSSKKRS